MLRATVKSLLARRFRVALTTLAIVIGVSFITGTQVLSATVARSAAALVLDHASGTDIHISPAADDGAPGRNLLSAAEVGRAAAVTGVASAKAAILGDGAARVFDKRAKPMINQAGQRFGSWIGEDRLVKLAEGRAPRADTEVVINAGLAAAGRFRIADPITVRTTDAVRHEYTVVGIVRYSGGRESIDGEYAVWFTEAVARQVVLHGSDGYTTILVDATDGVPAPKLRDALQAALGPAV